MLPASHAESERPVAVLEHRQITASAWRELLHELSVGVPTGPLPRSSAVHKALMAEQVASVVVQYLSQLPVTVEHPHEVAPALDRFLKSQVDAYDRSLT
jgi:hypothetical protein